MTQWLPLPPDKLFPFFSDERNLEKITPPWLNFRVLRKSTEKMGSGTTIDYRLRVHGIPLSWQSRIEDWNPNTSFVDTQVKGPYALWHHTHTFEPKDGGTLMTDHVRYEVPAGRLGNFLAGSYVRKDLEKIFHYRTEVLEKIFREGKSPSPRE